ncbi:MAG: hypothetical protein IKX65_05010 [Prevotella sp.]|nr:hypothetical protein [Prevotella sp.]
MYRKKRFSIFFIILFLSNLSLCHMVAQETEDTHAHASSFKWKGINKDDVIDHSEYATTGKTIFLYNVGTGRFIIEGGNFGMEGRLFHETFGRPLSLLSNGLILSGVEESTSGGNKVLFGCNIPGVFHDGKWTEWNKYSFTIMMDARKDKRKVNGVYNGWKFDRIQGETGDTYTYYMYEEKNNKKYFLGAAYGECHADGWKENGTLVLLDDDRATWTSIDPRRVQEKYKVNGDMITLDELYQWRLVSEEQFIGMLDNEDIGLNPSVSIFINDRDFTRNSLVFSDSWLVEEKAGAGYTDYRLGYTYGSLGNTSAKQETYNNEAWNKPIRLKHVFEKKNNNDVVPYEDGSNVTVDYGWKNAKYGFLSFEGVGRTYTEVEVPRAGWYLVQCYGFVQSDQGHDAYLFARVKGSNETSSTGGESKINLKKVDAGTYTGKNARENCLAVGKELTKNGEKYKYAVWICVTDEQFNSGHKTLQIGVGKDEATQSSVKRNNGKDYYYDTDWVCVDDFRMSYLGLRPAFFYEDEESLDYLTPSENNSKQYWAASPTGQYGGAICIERSLKPNQWNTFSFPMPLTGEQIRNAFGEDAMLAGIHSVGKMSLDANVIDFKSISLRTSDPVVIPGHFYLLKPTLFPIKGDDPKGSEREYYELGRKFFSVNDEGQDYQHFKLSRTTVMESSETIESLDGNHNGVASVVYVQTPDFENFSVKNGIYNGQTETDIYAPKGSYAVSYSSTTNKATIFHLNRDTRIKGFRGWINLDQPVGQQAKDFSMEVYGMFDKEPVVSITTDIDLPRILLFNDNEPVYDLTGRKVGTLGTSLPKGMYIVRGKKFFVK